MSSVVLPSLPVEVEVERIPQFAPTTVFTTVSGKEQRVNWQSAPRYGYRLVFPGLRAGVTISSGPYAGMTEIAAVLAHFESHRGAWDSWLMTDPYTGAEVRVRFVDDALTMTRIVNGWWRVEAEVIGTESGSPTTPAIPTATSITIRSPDGTSWLVTVGDDGAITTTEI